MADVDALRAPDPDPLRERLVHVAEQRGVRPVPPDDVQQLRRRRLGPPRDDVVMSAAEAASAALVRVEGQLAEQHARTEQLLGSIGGKLDGLVDRPVGDVYLPAEAVRDALLEVLGGGLEIRGTATPMSGTSVPVLTEKGPTS